MSLNHKEIDAVLKEMDIEGSFVQKVLQPSYGLLILELYKPGRALRLLVSIEHGACRLHETRRSFPRPPKPLRFALLLKSRIQGLRVSRAAQLGSDRIVRLDLGGEDGFRLYARLWSAAANIILTDSEGRIVDAMARRPGKGEVTGGFYAPEADARPAAPSAKAYEIRPIAPGKSLSEAFDETYGEKAGETSLESLRERVRRLYASRISRIEALIERLEAQEREYGDAERNKHYGDLIMASAAMIPEGASRVELEDFDELGRPAGRLSLRLDASLNALDNARAFYEKAKKAKSGLHELKAELIAAREKRDRLSARLSELMQSEDPALLLSVISKAEGARAERAKHSPVGMRFERECWKILVGRSSKENDELLRRHAKGNDLWLHARDYPGSYVFVKARQGKSVPLDVLLDAANLALYHSKGRNAGSGDLYYTQVKYLRRAKDGPRGLVIPTQEKNLHVCLDHARIKRLNESLNAE
jgi:predicted ribosome quality control (RQC) complex YloA/Tae2 family protein